MASQRRAANKLESGHDWESGTISIAATSGDSASLLRQKINDQRVFHPSVNRFLAEAGQEGGNSGRIPNPVHYDIRTAI
jgi:hypothetical protein